MPYLERRLNFSLGCYGCREATDLGPGETVIGFPGTLLSPLLAALAALRAKAVPRSRSKSAYAGLIKRLAGGGEASAAPAAGDGHPDATVTPDLARRIPVPSPGPWPLGPPLSSTG